jgi:hypothetical protein
MQTCLGVIAGVLCGGYGECVVFCKKNKVVIVVVVTINVYEVECLVFCPIGMVVLAWSAPGSP